MKTTDRTRRMLILAALAATVAAAGWVGSEDDAAVPIAEATAPRRAEVNERRRLEKERAPAAEDAIVDIGRLQQRAVTTDFGDMFPNRSWEPPPPPPSKPPPPKAPPLPFSFFGRMIENGGTVVFLSRGDQTLAAKEGETLAGTYRVEEIGPASVVFTYLPLDERQVLNIGAIN